MLTMDQQSVRVVFLPQRGPTGLCPFSDTTPLELPVVFPLFQGKRSANLGLCVRIPLGFDGRSGRPCSWALIEPLRKWRKCS
jgi:hypothetical protein